MATTYKEKASLWAKRSIGFLKTLKSNRRGMLGIGIIVFFIGLAAFAPILTQNDPVDDYFVASDFAAPSWLRYFPGTQRLSENSQLIANPGFATSSSVFEEWNFTKTTTSIYSVALQWRPDVGYPIGTGPGSAVVVFTRNDTRRNAGGVTARLTKEFYYPYQGPPGLFKCDIAFLAQGTQEVPVYIRVAILRIEQSDTKSYTLWSTGKIETTSTEWIIPRPALDSYSSKEWVKQYFGAEIGLDPAKVIFSNQTNYILDITVLFKDDKTTSLGRSVEAKVYLDDIDLKLYGTAYGLLGTDHRGRDVFSQLVHGARISLFIGLLSAFISTVIGLFVGLISGYLGGTADELIMRFNDALLVLPGLPLLLVLAAVLGASIWNLIIIIGILGWMGFARQVRSQTLSLKERPFIEAAKSVGAGKLYIIRRHILPNVMSLVYVSLALSVPVAIVSEAALSWLGLYDPFVMSWGRMLHDIEAPEGGGGAYITNWWWVLPPGLCIALISLSFILIGYALDEILNPRLRQRR